MRTKHPPAGPPIDLETARSPEGIDRSERLAFRTMDYFVDVVDEAGLDISVAATLLAVELLTALKLDNNADADVLFQRVRTLVDQRLSTLDPTLSSSDSSPAMNMTDIHGQRWTMH